MGRILPAFFGNEELVWLTGGLLLFGGLLIVAFHHYWTSPAVGAIPVLRIGFGAVLLVGVWLTYRG